MSACELKYKLTETSVSYASTIYICLIYTRILKSILIDVHGVRICNVTLRYPKLTIVDINCSWNANK